jgi:hypothetical protein
VAVVPSVLFTVTLTCVPAVPAGVVAVMLELLTTATLLAFKLPNSTAAPVRKFEPVIVTPVPPAAGPLFGLTLVIVGEAGGAGDAFDWTEPDAQPARMQLKSTAMIKPRRDFAERIASALFRNGNIRSTHVSTIPQISGWKRRQPTRICVSQHSPTTELRYRFGTGAEPEQLRAVARHGYFMSTGNRDWKPIVDFLSLQERCTGTKIFPPLRATGHTVGL